MSRIHHATAKKAAKLGIEIEDTGKKFVLTYEGQRLIVTDVKAGIEQIAQFAADESGEVEEPEWAEDGDENEDEDEESEGKSVVKRVYKQRYRPFKQRCGDELAVLITNHVSTEGEDGEMRIDPVKLKRFAKHNDCWVDSYAFLNVGMQRMNVRNRLAAKVRRDGHEIVWN